MEKHKSAIERLKSEPVSKDDKESLQLIEQAAGEIGASVLAVSDALKMAIKAVRKTPNREGLAAYLEVIANNAFELGKSAMDLNVYIEEFNINHNVFDTVTSATDAGQE